MGSTEARIGSRETQLNGDHGKYSYRSPTEQEILRVLWASPKRLVRGEILKNLPQEHRPSAGRVGQILASLHGEKLLDRVLGKAQGSNAAGFYELSRSGRLLCQQLGFEQQIRFASDPELLKANLSRRRLAAAVQRSGRIVVAWGNRGGLGRTTLVAHLAKGLGEKLTGDQCLLAADLDFASPDLDEFFARQGEPECRGLGGLLMDFRRHEPKKRAFFLLRSLRDPKYVINVEGMPRIFYLPSGMSPNHQALSAAERAEALTLLRQEAEEYAATRNGAGDGLVKASDRADETESPGFLEALREAMAERFERVVVDAQKGHSLAAWIATQTLADELVLCLQLESKISENRIAAVRSLLASFLERNAGSARSGAVKFMFRLTAPTTLKDLDRWIDEKLVMEEAGPERRVTYGCEQIPYNARMVENQYRDQNTHFYMHLIARLLPGSIADCDVCPPELQAVKVVLDAKNPNKRSIAAGVLENTPIEELARWIQWAKGEGFLPRKTDAEGADLLRGVFEAHAMGLFETVLGSEVSWNPETALGSEVSWNPEEGKGPRHAAATASAPGSSSGG